jgi:hypothetical protein
MPNFIWSFNNLRVQASQGDLSDAVVAVGYRLCCTDSYRSVYRYGELAFAPADPAVFTPFQEISQQDMAAFAEQTLGSELAVIQQELLAELAAPPIDVRPLPWEVEEAFSIA